MPRATAEQLDEVQTAISKMLASQERVIDNTCFRPWTSALTYRRTFLLLDLSAQHCSTHYKLVIAILMVGLIVLHSSGKQYLLTWTNLKINKLSHCSVTLQLLEVSS